MAVERLRTCDDVNELAQELGVTRRCLYKWRVKLETIEPGEDAWRPSTHTSPYRKQIHQLKRMLAERAMEVDFFKGALQKVEARRQKKDGTGGSEQLSIKLQELAGISGAGIGDDKADVEIVSGGGELPDEILAGDIKHDDSMLHTVTLAKFNAYFLKQVLPSRNEDNVDS